jgi:hypothetical protein
MDQRLPLERLRRKSDVAMIAQAGSAYPCFVDGGSCEGTAFSTHSVKEFRCNLLWLRALRWAGGWRHLRQLADELLFLVGKSAAESV